VSLIIEVDFYAPATGMKAHWYVKAFIQGPEAPDDYASPELKCETIVEATETVGALTSAWIVGGQLLVASVAEQEQSRRGLVQRARASRRLGTSR
jgi:hypothetical protein